MKEKYVFLDIDGTVAMPGDDISPKLIQAIEAARKNGHKIFINTGRSFKDIPDYLHDIDFDGFVSSAGGRILVGDELIHEETLAEEDVKEIINLLQSLDVYFFLEGRVNNYCNQNNLEKFDFTNLEEASSELLRSLELDDEANVTKPIPIEERSEDDPIYKINFRIFDPEVNNEIKDALKNNLDSKYSLCFFENLFPGVPFTMGEITYNHITKGEAIKNVCNYYGADIEDTISFGDSMNDAAMIKAAGIGYAMGNSVQEVKDLADRVCPSVEEDGVAVAFSELGLLD